MITRLSNLRAGHFSLVFAAAMLATVMLALGTTGVAAAISSAVMAQSSRDDYSYADDVSPPVDEPTEIDEPELVGSTPDPTPTEDTGPALAPLPRSCDDLYSPQMRALLASHAVELNPGRTGRGVTGVAYSDPVIDETIQSIPTLRCFWGDPGTRTGFVMETRIAAVTEEQSHGVQSRLASIGYIPIQELGSTRYYFADGVDYYGMPYGESHIVVGGYWFATAWAEVGITGYTADMVRSVLG